MATPQSHKLRTKTNRFVGRDKEIETFGRLLQSPSENILVITGESGVGKSLLIDVLGQECAHRGVRWAKIDLRDNSSGKIDLLYRLATQLDQQDEFGTFFTKHAKYVNPISGENKPTKGNDVSALQKSETELLETFQSCLKGLTSSYGVSCKCTIFFDTFEQISGTELEQWFLESFMTFAATAVSGESNVLVVVAGQPSEGLNSVQPAVRRTLLAFSPSMIHEYFIKYFQRIDSSAVVQVLDITAGNPLNVGILVDILKIRTKLDTAAKLDRLHARISKGTVQEKVTTILIDELLGQMIDGGKAAEAILLRKCSVPRWFDAEHVAFISAIPEKHLSDVYILYEAGLDELLRRLGRDHPQYPEALIYEQRLRENILSSRKYGNRDTFASERAEVIDGLNRIAVLALGISFNDLCKEMILASPVLASEQQLLASIPDRSYIEIERLRKFSFVKQRALGGYFYHESVRETFLQRWRRDSSEGLRVIDLRWGQFYQRRFNGQKEVGLKRQEAPQILYHLLRYEEDTGVEFLARNIGDSDTFRDVDYFARLARELRSTKLEPGNRLWLDYLGAYQTLYRGNWHIAAAELRRILEQKEVSPVLVALVAYELGKVLAINGDNPGAERLYLQALEIQRKRKDFTSISRILLRLGQVYRWTGDWERAIGCFEEGLQISTARDDKLSLAWILINLGITYRLQGNLGRARSVCEQSLQIYRDMNDQDGVGRNLRSLGEIYITLGCYKEAEEAFQECMQVLEPSAQRYSLAKGRIDLAAISILLQKYDKVEKYLTDAEALIEQMGAKSMLPTLLSVRAKYLRATGNPAEALSILEAIRTPGNSSSSLSGESILGDAAHNMSFADTLADLKRYKEARCCYEQSIENLRILKAQYLLAVAQVSLCEVKLKEYPGSMNDVFDADLEGAMGLASANNYRDVMARVHKIRATLCLRKDDPEKARESLSLAYDEATKYNPFFAKTLFSGCPDSNYLMDNG